MFIGFEDHVSPNRVCSMVIRHPMSVMFCSGKHIYWLPWPCIISPCLCWCLLASMIMLSSNPVCCSSRINIDWLPRSFVILPYALVPGYRFTGFHVLACPLWFEDEYLLASVSHHVYLGSRINIYWPSCPSMSVVCLCWFHDQYLLASMSVLVQG